MPPTGTPAPALPLTSNAAPENPPISPTTTFQPRGAARNTTRSKNASHSGINAMMSDTMLVGVPMFSDTATSAFPPSSRKTPTMPAARHCFEVVRSPVRIDVHAKSTVPANRKRAAAPSSVGTVSLTFSMPR